MTNLPLIDLAIGVAGSSALWGFGLRHALDARRREQRLRHAAVEAAVRDRAALLHEQQGSGQLRARLIREQDRHARALLEAARAYKERDEAIAADEHQKALAVALRREFDVVEAELRRWKHQRMPNGRFRNAANVPAAGRHQTTANAGCGASND